MSQSPVPPLPGPPRPAQDVSPRTGSSQARSSQPSGDVAQVLASLEQLEELPVADHVAFFEQAHVTLRQALDEAGAGPSARG